MIYFDSFGKTWEALVYIPIIIYDCADLNRNYSISLTAKSSVRQNMSLKIKFIGIIFLCLAQSVDGKMIKESICRYRNI